MHKITLRSQYPAPSSRLGWCPLSHGPCFFYHDASSCVSKKCILFSTIKNCLYKVRQPRNDVRLLADMITKRIRDS